MILFKILCFYTNKVNIITLYTLYIGTIRLRLHVQLACDKTRRLSCGLDTSLCGHSMNFNFAWQYCPAKLKGYAVINLQPHVMEAVEGSVQQLKKG